jgi:hypothetical protein
METSEQESVEQTVNRVEGVAFRFPAPRSLVTVYVLLKSISDAVARPLLEEGKVVRLLRAATAAKSYFLASQAQQRRKILQPFASLSSSLTSNRV